MGDKHTPGPWSIDWFVGRIEIFSSDGNTLVASIRRSALSATVDERAKANARLIAAAPESHASNVELAGIVRDMCRTLLIPEPEDALARSDAAIAKATGR